MPFSPRAETTRSRSTRLPRRPFNVDTASYVSSLCPLRTTTRRQTDVIVPESRSSTPACSGVKTNSPNADGFNAPWFNNPLR
jgi:hypothetical protein